METRKEDDYFDTHTAPASVAAKVQLAERFIDLHAQVEGRRVVLITSGGTTVPLERNTVRFLDNFSQGTRGASSAEYFLRLGYAVIFMHRAHSLQPFARHVQQLMLTADEKTDYTADCMLNCLSVDTDGMIRVSTGDSNSEMVKLINEYKHYTAPSFNRLLLLSFVTVQDYLFMLRDISRVLGLRMGSRAMWYLAAAVSDFHVPHPKLAEHKIQSGSNSTVFSLQMDQVPKVLKPLVQDWASNGFIVSFKLETDEGLIEVKSKMALERYGHQIVVANLLQTRKSKVTLFAMSDNSESSVERAEIVMSGDSGEIEELIVRDLVGRHSLWISSLSSSSSKNN
eukprot:Partr_v1_DN28646_c1_g1_i2_m49944 putative phosphopantothenate-cysteine ligase